MFAYCNNNPANCSDATGMIAKTCLTADGRIEDSPWRNHSPGGGGFVYRCANITTQYDGDKFYTQMIAREAWNLIKKGAKWAWDAYDTGYSHYQQAQLRNGQLLVEGARYLASRPEEAIDLIGATVGMSSATYKIAILIVAGNPTTATVAGAVLGLVCAGWGLYRGIKGIASDFLP